MAICLCGLSLVGTVGAVDEDNDYIYFGSYPQSKVDNYWILGELNALAPEWESWTSYGYYSGTNAFGSMVQGDWMRYFDVTFNGEKYRAVKFTEYRPMDTYFESPSNTSSLQYMNGYCTDTVYWFKYEPLKWRILDKDTGLVMCETVIDVQPYNNTVYMVDNIGYNDAAGQNYANDYASSSIRAWLNADFYNTAFSDSEKTAISKTTLNNDCKPTIVAGSGYEQYDGDETEDNIFLLSYDQAINTNYGFISAESDDTARVAYLSDYAKSQGGFPTQDSTTTWNLRTSAVTAGRQVCDIKNYGNIEIFTAEGLNGIRPAMTLNIFAGGSGTEADPYQIATLGHLEAFRGSVNAGNDYEGKYITLTNNIDMSEKYGNGKENWTPIGVYKSRLNNKDREGAMPFKGTFDGNGYAVIGLYIYNSETIFSKNYQALFSYNAESGVIKNLTVYGCVFDKHGTNCAGIVAENYGTISNCINNAEVHGTSNVAGVVAYSHGGVITNCINNGYINAVSYICGGIVAYKSPELTHSKIEKCYNTGEVQGEDVVGGIVGRVAGQSKDDCISNCYNVGDVYIFDGINGGAIVGHAEINFFMLNSLFNTGTIGYGDVGGIIGRYSNISDRYPVGGTNTYYLEDCYDKDEDVQTTLNGYGTAMSAEAFKDGTVTALLQGDQSEQIWKQGKEHPELILDYSKMTTKITFDVDGVTKTEYINGDAFSKLDNPTKDGFTFGGWYTDKDCTDGNEYTFGSQGGSEVTIYAKWTAIPQGGVDPSGSTDTNLPTWLDILLSILKLVFKVLVNEGIF